MITNCEHNKYSMFAVGPCEKCKKKCSMSSNAEYKSHDTHYEHYNDVQDIEHKHLHVHWPDICDSKPVAEEIIQNCQEHIDQTSNSHPKPILKHRVHCVLLEH